MVGRPFSLIHAMSNLNHLHCTGYSFLGWTNRGSEFSSHIFMGHSHYGLSFHIVSNKKKLVKLRI